MLNQLPINVLDFVKDVKVGHLSVRTKSGVLVHPVAYYCDDEGIVFGTPRGSAKLKMLKKRPSVSFTVDNGKLMKEAMGITVVGKAETYGFKSLVTSLKSALISTTGFMRKYPELLKFYVLDMGELPDDRKFYKYVFVRINPTRIVYWDGYDFGRITSKSKKKSEPTKSPEEDPVIYAKYLMDYYNNLESIESEFENDIALEQLSDSLYNDEIYLNALKENTMDMTTLLSLPESLRKTGLAVLKYKKSTVDEIATEIGSTRREAKNYLDRLTLMKVLDKKREGDQMIYYCR